MTPDETAAAEKATADQAAADTKAAEEKATADKAIADAAVEVKWKGLKLPEGSTLDATLTERTAAKARELGLSPEQAQSTVDLLDAEARTAVAATVEAHKPGGAVWTAQVDTWEKQALADPDLGAGNAEKLQAAVAKAKAVMTKFFPKDVHEYLHTTGFGSHPAVLKGFLAVAKASAEGTFDLPKAADTRDTATMFYPPKT